MAKSKTSSNLSDDYSRLGYRRFVAWPARIRREGPLLLRSLRNAPGRRVLDLGCASGEHSRFLAEEGFSVVGVDQSETSLALARDVESRGEVRYVQGDLRDLDRLVPPGFDGAICLGNTLVHLVAERDLSRALEALASVLVEGGVLLFQILNYHRLRETQSRYLPLNFVPEEGGDRVFLRLMDFREDGRVLFCPTTLEFRPDEPHPVRVLESRSVELRGWEREELLELLGEAGFRVTALLGDMSGRPFVVSESNDLIVVAERRRGE